MKLAKLLLSLSFSVCIMSQSRAQVTNYKMSDYKYRTPGMKALSLYGNVNSTFIGAASVPANGSFLINPTLGHLKLYSTDQAQFELKQTGALALNKMVSSDFTWSVNYMAEWFKRNYKGNKFLQYGSNSGFNVSNGNIVGKKQVFTDAALNPHVGVGIGRLEYVSNAQMALFILNDLKEAGKIKGTISDDAAKRFTDLITELYNTRVFDFRVRRNYEVTKIDSFLRANKIISGGDIQIYNIISDNWNYAIQPVAIEATSFTYGTLMVNDINRFSDRINQFGVFSQPRRYEGVRKTVSLTLPSSYKTNPNYSFGVGLNEFNLGLTDSTIDKYSRTDYGARLLVIYENHHVKSLFIQRIFGFSAGYNHDLNKVRYQFSNRADSTVEALVSNISVGGNYGYQYYPNSRTVLQAVGTLAVARNGGSINQVALSNFISTVIGANCTATWFLSYRSRISGNAQLAINSGNSLVSNNFSFSIQYINYLF